MLIIVVVVVVIYCYNHYETAAVLKENNIKKNDWAYYNIGQTIEGKKGMKAVDINIVPLWKTEIRIKPIIVSVVDSGVYMDGQLTKGKIWNNKKEIKDGLDNDENFLVDDIYGWDFCNDNGSVYDDYAHDYHGTYIANEILKINPNARIQICKFMDGSSGKSINAIKAIKYAIQNKSRIINCSWMFYENSEELKKIIHKNKNVLFICAAGNSNVDLDETPVYPACYYAENVISVGAINSSGSIYSYSGYGQKNVDLMAPGESINGTLPEDDKATIDGTSIATAYVTGCASLLLGIDATLSAQEIKNIIIKSATEKPNLEKMCVSSGYLNIYNAYRKYRKAE